MKQIDYIYSDRSEFCVVALTGYTATGCSRLADYMENQDFLKLDEIRKPSSLPISDIKSTNNSDIFFNSSNSDISQIITEIVFKRKYSICHNFIQARYKPFTVIKYTKVLMMMSLVKLCSISENAKDLKTKFAALLKDKFQPSTVSDLKYREMKASHPWENIETIIKDLPFDKVYEEIKELDKPELKDNDKYDEKNNLVADTFLGRQGKKHFNSFYNDIHHRLFETDYYSCCFFYHRLGLQLRKTGKVDENYDKVFDAKENFRHVYDVVKYINRIIKGIRFPNKTNEDADDRDSDTENLESSDTVVPKGCRVVVDSIRNSLEARYLKERYSAFYLIAVHDDENRARHHLTEKMNTIYDIPEEKKDDVWKTLLNKEVDCIFKLGKKEQKNDHFEEGKFSAPNTEQCVADAEIHILNTDNDDKEAPYFQSMAEQWMKFASLILHPGIITPSPEERCMVVAYTAKFNSGCLSRQVGAVITNKAHSIRSIGWNDVPYGQIPCSLRSLYDFPEMDNADNPRFGYMYSDFERGEKKYHDGHTFRKSVLIKYGLLRKHGFDKDLNGLPLSYCFKSLHNEFEGNKNQVHTRSLHAEENAMLQISRFGGEGLENGIIYVTASPCELCCKKLYQIGVRKIIYIDEYPGISRQNIISIGFKRPDLKQFQGAYGVTYFKLYQPIMSQKDEFALRLKGHIPTKKKSLSSIMKDMMEKNPELKFSSQKELDNMIALLKDRYTKGDSQPKEDPNR